MGFLESRQLFKAIIMVSLTASSSTVNQSRFEELWSENESVIRRYVWSLRPGSCAIEDILQETSIALWRKFDAYDTTRPFAAWGCRFALLQVLKHRQRCLRDRLVFDYEDGQIERTIADHRPNDDMVRARQDALKKALMLLDESQRQLIHCRYDSKETIQSMAKRRATSVHRLYHTLDSVRATLKNSIDKVMISEGWERSEFT